MKTTIKLLFLSLVVSMSSCVTLVMDDDNQCPSGCDQGTIAPPPTGGGAAVQGVSYSRAMEAGTFFFPSTGGYDLLYSAPFCTVVGDIVALMNEQAKTALQMVHNDALYEYGLAHIETVEIMLNPQESFYVDYLVSIPSRTTMPCGVNKTDEEVDQPEKVRRILLTDEGRYREMKDMYEQLRVNAGLSPSR